MATYYARKSGNINATDVWATTPTGTAAAVTFAAGDVLLSNGFAITVNVSTDLGSTGQVRNDTTGGATAGGAFSLSNGVTLTASVFAGTATCTTLSSGSASIVGNITGGSAANASGVSFSSTGTLTITGSLTGGSAAAAVTVTAAGTLSITGDVNASGFANGRGINNFGGFLSVFNVVGNVTGTSAAAAIAGSSQYSSTITGNVTNNGMSIVNAGTHTVTGTATGGTLAGITGTVDCQLTVTRAKGGPLAASAVGVASVSTSGFVAVESIEFGDLGASPTSGPIRLVDKTSNVAVMYRFGTTKKTLVDANASGLMPAASNVRSGVVYNGGNSTGTCAVPAAGSVALGVPVDNTTGTAALTPAAVWDYLTSAATTSGSMGERLKDAATVASTGQQLADALTP